MPDVTVTDLDHPRHMRRAIELAKEAGVRGDEPFGAVLVAEDAEVLEASNTVVTENDIALHPELTLARAAANRQDAADLVLYASTEPCGMCAGGIAIAGVGGVVYSVHAGRARELAGQRGHVAPTGSLLERLDDVSVTAGVLEAEGEAVHREYW